MMDMEAMVGFVGAGTMAFAIASGLVKADNVHRGNVMGSAPSDKNLIQFKNGGMQTTHCNESVLRSCSVIFLTIKPNILPTVLGEIYSLVTPEHLLISVAAGITVQTLEKLLPAGTRVLRTMPNLACQVQEGTMVFCRGSHATEQDASHLQRLMSGCSLCEETPEAFINIHSGLSGSGVAYAYMFAEALADGGVKMGMPYHLSLRLAGQTLVGAGKMMLETGEHPAKLKGDVCTPGGTTIHAIHELERGNLRSTVMNAVEAATNQARNMGKS
uniref:Pyrroline-5-carboxylate reductase n=1 Tax=Callorhinchus milii TaxID=7868 RepID=K4GIM1_CALMI|nr:putative pyrroline-5-carboxylate reductase-like variant 2 [Callorhinchus milii]